MTAEHFSTIVIGSGSGGMTVAVGLANLGTKVALVEGHHVAATAPMSAVCHQDTDTSSENFKPGMSADEIMREVTRKRDALREKRLKKSNRWRTWFSFKAGRNSSHPKS